MDAYILHLRNNIHLYESALYFPCSNEEVTSGVSGWSVWLLFLWLACEIRNGESPAPTAPKLLFPLLARSRALEQAGLSLLRQGACRRGPARVWFCFSKDIDHQLLPSSLSLGSAGVLHFFLCRSLLKRICCCAMPKQCSLNCMY